MKNDIVHYCLTFSSVSSLLWWLLITCILGMLIFGGALLEILRFITDKKGKSVSIVKFQKIHTAAEMKEFLNGLTVAGLKMLRKSLVVDYIFMPFFYLALFSATNLLIFQANSHTDGWMQLLLILRWVPLLSWLLDVTENASTLALLRNYQANPIKADYALVLPIYASFVLKWFTLVAWAVCIVSLMITRIVG